jgi:hypothetical protein
MNDLGTEVQATEALKPEVGLGETERNAEKQGDAEESGAEESGAEKQGGAEESGEEKQGGAEKRGDAEESGVFLGGEESKTVLVFDLMTGAALDHDAKSQVMLQKTGI